jgi:hypothetical protein
MSYFSVDFGEKKKFVNQDFPTHQTLENAETFSQT